MKMQVALILSLVARTLALPRASTHRGSGRIIGGSETGETEFPHQISLQIPNFGSWLNICGGAIYDETRIITSAICLVEQDVSELRVVAGDHDLDVESGEEQIRTISFVEMHPDFGFEFWDHDICILTLSAPLVFNARVQPIRLAESSFVPSGVAVTTGYGAVEVNGVVYGKLLKASLNIIGNADCNRIYDGETTVPGITPTMLCAEAEGTGVCNGDWGSPLVAKDDANREFLAGLASWSAPNCFPKYGLPNVYTNIGPLRAWLESKLNP